MEQNNKISQSIATKLQYAVAIASEIRLRVYMKRKGQDDVIDLNENEGIEGFLKIVGVTTTINYFQIAYCLQCEIAKQLNFTKLHFYSDPQLINITLSLEFRLKIFTSLDSMSFSNNTLNRFWKPSNFDFDTCIAQLEANTKWNLTTDIVKTYSSKKSNINSNQIKIIASQLYLNEIYDEALEFYKQLLKIYQSKNKIISNSVSNSSVIISNNKINIAACNIVNNEYEAEMLFNIGICYFHLTNYSDALMFLNLDIFQNTALNPDKDRNIAITLCNIGNCHRHLCNYSDALTFLNRALDIKQNTALNPDKDRNIAITLCNIGNCHRHLCNYSDALTFLNRALDIKQNTALNPDKDRNIAITLCNIGNCHRHLCNYSDALTFLSRALDIFQNTALNPDKDRNIASTLGSIGIGHIDLCNYSDALTFLNRALDIEQNTALNPDKDRNIAITLVNIEICHWQLCNYSNA